MENKAETVSKKSSNTISLLVLVAITLLVLVLAVFFCLRNHWQHEKQFFQNNVAAVMREGFVNQHKQDMTAQLALLTDRVLQLEVHEKRAALDASSRRARTLQLRQRTIAIMQYMQLARLSLVYTIDVNRAIWALDRAYQMSLQPSWLALSEVLRNHLVMLRACPPFSPSKIQQDIAALSALIDTLPLWTDMKQPSVADHKQPVQSLNVPSVPWYQRYWSFVKERFFSVIWVRRLDDINIQVTTPDQIFYLRQYMKALLFSANIDVLSNNQPSFAKKMTVFVHLLQKYFDKQQASVAFDTAKTLLAVNFPQPLPNLKEEDQLLISALQEMDKSN